MANPTSKLDLVVNGVTTSYDIHDANAIPRSGGAVMTGNELCRTINTDQINISGGSTTNSGANILLYGGQQSDSTYAGSIRLTPCISTDSRKFMRLYVNGTWTWDGSAVQITSDQRLKQQITQIDDKLLDAWEDVELSQFKYNDAVEQKGKSARLHTGYVVQQIQKACESHGVDISAYGLFCHEEYPEETEEVEVEQKDGTKTKERKVIREANEHYSLRYAEALIVECKYLRRCIERLEARLAQLENPEESQEKGADK